MIRALLVLLAFATPLCAETVRVISGEHSDFTRLVIELPEAADWSVGRTSDGYAFSTKSERQPDFDLSSVWQRIPRSRLATLEADPATGTLLLGLGCDCHVFPFEYSPGIIVLDIKAGPAPAGSAFEAAISEPVEQAAADTDAYNWLSAIKPDELQHITRLPLALDTGAISLAPLRDELLEQIAKGAADGVVDMELPGKIPEPRNSTHAVLPWSNIRIGEQTGVSITNPGALIADSGTKPGCAPAGLLDLAAWGDGHLPHDLLADSRIGLYGEFDTPDEDAVLRSVRQLLYLGFGVEALQTANLLGPEATNKAFPLYRSMARILDGEGDVQTPFAKMLECDGPAALWAALAHDRFPPGPTINRDAILQGYQALPPHLRRHLGPGLAEKFLARDDGDAARMIRDIMERSPDVDPGSIALLDAKSELHEGDAEAAQTHAESAVALDGDDAESLVALVEAHFRKLEPMTPDTAEALLSLQRETGSSSLGPEVARSLVLALALSGQTEAAFAQDGATEVLADLWQVVNARAPDDDFLMRAVLPARSPTPDVASDVRQAVANRLLLLGFPDAALTWLGPISAVDAQQMRLMAATAELGRGDAREALSLLSGLEGTDAIALRGQALLQLGDLPAARTAFADAGNVDGAVRTELWQGNWDSLDAAASDTWRLAADSAQPQAPDAEGLLGRGKKTTEASLLSRDAIEALLAGVPSPTAD